MNKTFLPNTDKYLADFIEYFVAEYLAGHYSAEYSADRIVGRSLFRISKARQAKNSWHKVRKLVHAFIKVGNSAVEHRVDPAIFDLVDMPGVWDKLQDELGQEGKKMAVRHYQNIVQLHASFWSDADTLHVAVVVPGNEDVGNNFRGIQGQESTGIGGNRLAYLQLDEEVLLVHWATGMIAHTGDMDKCIEVDTTRYCNMAYVLEDKAEPSCQGAVWRSEWSEATQRCPIRMVRARATVWALEKGKFLVVLPNTTECTFTCGREPPQTRELEGQHRVSVDARQRNERNARMGTLETGWLRVGAISGSADLTRKLNMSTLRLRGSHFVYKKLVPNKPQNKKLLI
jgi:hypothetical protein